MDLSRGLIPQARVKRDRSCQELRQWLAARAYNTLDHLVQLLLRLDPSP